MYQNIAFLAFLYFIQGLPYGLQSRFLPVYFRTKGMSLTDISIFKLLLTPWMCKALWAPFVDRYGTKKAWLLWSMLGLIITCVFGCFTPPEGSIVTLAFVLFLFNLLTSTQDIAVDGIAIQILTSSELAYGNIAQVVGYKFGAIFGGGILTWLSEYLQWSFLFFALSMVYVVSSLLVMVFIPAKKVVNLADSESHKMDDHLVTDKEQPLWKWFFKHLAEVFSTPGTKWVIAFVLLYKLGEQGAMNLVPLYLVDKAIAASQVGFWTGVVGQVVSIAGSVLGGWLISHVNFTTLKLLKLSCIVRIFPLFVQAMAIWFWSDHIASPLFVLSVSSMLLMLLMSGTVTTATFTMMMECSQMAPTSIQATHYTTIATLEVVGKLTFSVVIGPLTDYLGYKIMFFLFIALTVSLLPLFTLCPSNFAERVRPKNS